VDYFEGSGFIRVVLVMSAEGFRVCFVEYVCVFMDL
jgi:hypothetical protein